MFEILHDCPKEYKWKLKTPWGVISIYCGGLIDNPFKEQNGLAEYILSIHIKSYKKYYESH